MDIQAIDLIKAQLHLLYGDQADGVFARLRALLPDTVPAPAPLSLSEQDAIIIAYGDHVQRAGEAPLHTLRDVLTRTTLPYGVRGLHILPFYPSSSDDGFSVIDYHAVDPALGSWADIRAFQPDFRLMFDAVINHISAHSTWFQSFLRGEAPYDRYFVTVDPTVDLSQVVRPRTHPLLTPFATPSGTQHVWTTFSADQIDLNYANPDVLLDIIRVLLDYVAQGAALIRLDAIAFMWKEPGTSSIHLPQTHAIIQLLRAVLDVAAPQVILITETNVPHAENISYFGDGANEAQMVYQFPLPPLVLHTFRTGDASALSAWASTIQRVSDRTTFFNFTASHDGVGLRPATGLIPAADVQALVDLTLDHGGRVSYRQLPDGSASPYELNITYFDAITHPAITARDPDRAFRRFLCSQAIMLALIGVPGVYFHNLFGSRNWIEGVEQTGRARTINREKLDADALLRELADTASLRSRVYHGMIELLTMRASTPAFHPLGDQRVLDYGAGVFAVERTAPAGDATVIALHNVSDQAVSIATLPAGNWRDLNTGANVSAPLTLDPYAILWLERSG